MLSTLALTFITFAAVVFPAATVKFDVPAGWTSKAPTSSMRIAEFTLPRASGDPEDASVTVYFFSA